jgi:hypothetical protein
VAMTLVGCPSSPPPPPPTHPSHGSPNPRPGRVQGLPRTGRRSSSHHRLRPEAGDHLSRPYIFSSLPFHPLPRRDVILPERHLWWAGWAGQATPVARRHATARWHRPRSLSSPQLLLPRLLPRCTVADGVGVHGDGLLKVHLGP